MSTQYVVLLYVQSVLGSWHTGEVHCILFCPPADRLAASQCDLVLSPPCHFVSNPADVEPAWLSVVQCSLWQRSARLACVHHRHHQKLREPHFNPLLVSYSRSISAQSVPISGLTVMHRRTIRCLFLSAYEVLDRHNMNSLMASMLVVTIIT